MTAIRSSNAFISTPKDSPAYWLLDVLWVVHAPGEQTQGSYFLVEQWCRMALVRHRTFTLTRMSRSLSWKAR
jgi:hypothetical protein